MNVRERPVHSVAQLLPRVLRSLEHGPNVPLLVLRIPERAQHAERETLDAFLGAAERIVRKGDPLVHEPGSNWFAIAMLAPARGGAAKLTLDARSALERIAATMSLVIGRRMETGWWPIASRGDLDSFESTIERALERGARERERFEFLAMVGHELRTPLTSIRGYIETILDDGLDRRTTRRFLQVARNEALRLGRLVDGMLDFSLLDLGPQPAPGVTDMGAATRAALEALAPIAREARVRMQLRAGEGLFARIGADGCMHVLLNVIENGIKYGSPGGRVAISLERQDPFVQVTVDDDGPGVPADERERIFEHRARGGSARATPGTGIGLTIVRTIVERAAGSVNAQSSPLGGARFVIRLPAGKAESRPDPS
ncbi:MAG TPA: HAMP domain-containing sensor histidine kinase [Candidatus Baltobacteraceae bacterium]|nr:HAMP domain-containing sensor histidine kinase [Candidatus Baltobacteraceae bacterium]